LGNNLISEKGINQETSGATWTHSEDFHNMRNLGVPESLGRFFQFIPHAQVDSFRTSALSASQVVMVAMTVTQAINLRSVFAHSALNDTGFFELLETTISGNQVTGILGQGGKGLLGRLGGIGFRQGFQDRSALLGHPQTLGSKRFNRMHDHIAHLPINEFISLEFKGEKKQRKQLSGSALRLGSLGSVFFLLVKITFVKTRDRDTLAK
jgi:hypothetical protein